MYCTVHVQYMKLIGKGKNENACLLACLLGLIIDQIRLRLYHIHSLLNQSVYIYIKLIKWEGRGYEGFVFL